MNGIELNVLVAGPEDGPAVLLLQGFPDDHTVWRHQVPALVAAGYGVVAPDMRGYGGTDAPTQIEQYTILDLVGDMIALARELGAEQAIVVGHDWGAPVAWHCALASLSPGLRSASASSPRRCRSSARWTSSSG